MIPRHFVHSEHWFISNHLAILGPLEREACDTRVSKWEGIKNSFLIQLNFLENDDLQLKNINQVTVQCKM